MATIPTAEETRGPLMAFGRSYPEIIRLVLFGSLARGEAHENSDVDVVVDFVRGSTPRGMAGFAYLDDLESALAVHLGRSVHLVEQDALKSAENRGSYALPRAVQRDGILVYELKSAAA